MTALFKRAASLNVHGKVLQGLDFEFRVDRSLKPEPSKSDFSIFNLAPDNRKYLQSQKGGVIVEFRAGYASDTELALIYLGQLREVTTVRDGADWTTQISTGDGDKERKHPVGFSLGPGTSFDAAVKKSLETMGLKANNITKDIAGGKFGDASKELVEGFSAFGFAGPELDRLLDSGGLEGSIQNGELQVLPKGQALNKSAVTLRESTGLVGSPELGDKGSVKCRSLLNGEIVPGRMIHVISTSVDNFFRCERVVYSGQTAGNDWYCDIEAKPVEVVR
jgi:hypothetical protein